MLQASRALIFLTIECMARALIFLANECMARALIFLTIECMVRALIFRNHIKSRALCSDSYRPELKIVPPLPCAQMHIVPK